MCDRCRDPNKIDLTNYTIKKPDGSSRKTRLCAECAEYTRSVSGYKLTGGKATEAEPSAPESAEEDTTQSHTPQGGHSGHPADAMESSREDTVPTRRAK